MYRQFLNCRVFQFLARKIHLKMCDDVFKRWRKYGKDRLLYSNPIKTAKKTKMNLRYDSFDIVY